jgi:hypothetical protein
VICRFSLNRLNPAGKIKFPRRRSSKVLVRTNRSDSSSTSPCSALWEARNGKKLLLNAMRVLNNGSKRIQIFLHIIHSIALHASPDQARFEPLSYDTQSNPLTRLPHCRPKEVIQVSIRAKRAQALYIFIRPCTIRAVWIVSIVVSIKALSIPHALIPSHHYSALYSPRPTGFRLQFLSANSFHYGWRSLSISELPTGRTPAW